jgi:hypothetical protein
VVVDVALLVVVVDAHAAAENNVPSRAIASIRRTIDGAFASFCLVTTCRPSRPCPLGPAEHLLDVTTEQPLPVGFGAKDGATGDSLGSRTVWMPQRSKMLSAYCG